HVTGVQTCALPICDLAAEEDGGRIVEVHHRGEHGADASARGHEQLHGVMVTRARGRGDVGGSDGPLGVEDGGEHGALSGTGQLFAVPGERGSSRDGFDAAGLAAATDDGVVVGDGGVADVTGAALGAAV